MTIYLYVKTHRKTGLKYLGKTTSLDPHAYKGSGGIWKKHLKEHGIEFDTEIIRECQTKQELSQWGRYYSKLWNVVESQDWANQIPESGGGSCSPESAKKISATLTGRKKSLRTEEHKQNLSKATRGIPKPRSKEHQETWVESSKANWANNSERKKKVSELGKANKGKKHTHESLEKKRQAMIEYWRLKKSRDS
jgi:hypothetical protein